MDNFPIMAMKIGDPVTVTGYTGQHEGTVMWTSRGFCSYGGSWRVCVKLADGTTQEFEYGGERAHCFWR
jgi:hypothetical protein